MSDIRREYELAIQGIKATILDDICSEQGLVTILTNKMNNYSEEQKVQLNDLLSKQAERVENVLSALSTLDASMKELLEHGDEIRIVANENGEIKVTDAVPVVEAAPVVVSETQSAEIAAPVEVSPVVATPVVEAAPVVAPETQSTEVTAPVEVSPVVATPVVEAAPVVAPETQSTEVTAPVEVSPVVATPVVEAAPVVAPETQSTEVTTPVEVSPVVDSVAPTNEIVTSDSSSVAPADNGEVKVEAPADEVPFALTPIIEEGISPEAEVASAEVPMENSVTDSSATAVAEASDNIMKFSRVTNDPVKAILVTSVQLGKLTETRETQKALLSTANSATNTMASNTAVTEQTLVNNGLLAPSADDTKKQMEDMLIQANTLYQQGKTSEAQTIYDQVSSMNQSLQASASTDANVLVKAA